MNVINLIRSILVNYHSVPLQLEIHINGKIYSFFEGINIIDCNQLSKDRYIVKCNDNKDTDISNIDYQHKIMFMLIDRLESIVNNKHIKHKYYLNDTTKTLFYVSIDIPIQRFKIVYEELIKLDLSETAQYIICNIESITYLHYYNDYFNKTYLYEQVLMNDDNSISKSIESNENYILIKLCHDNILITESKITFTVKESYDIVLKILPFFNISPDDVFIECDPLKVTFNYPISINFQLFDMMLLKYNLFFNIYTNESINVMSLAEKVIYTLDIYKTSFVMNLYNKWKTFNETIQFQEVQWYMYSTIKIIVKYLYFLYIDFHNEVMIGSDLHFNIPIKINYNKLFGNYYTRYFNNKDKVLPVIADKEYCDRNSIRYVQWKDNYYMAPLNSGYTINLTTNKSFNKEGKVPKCVKVIRNASNKKNVEYSNLSSHLDENSKGILPPTLFVPYGFELSMLYRVHFDIVDSLIEFKRCPKCHSYIGIPSKENFINSVKNRINNSRYFENENIDAKKINILAFSVDDNSEVYPYAVSNYLYNYNSSFSFLVIMLNTTKLYTVSNYRYEFIISSSSKLFYKDDPLVKAIFSLYSKNNISIIDNNDLQNCVKQFVQEDDHVILIAEERIEKTNCYLWYSFYSNIIPEVSIISSSQLESLLPELSDLYDHVKDISAYHYYSTSKDNEENNNIIVYGVWSNNKYYPCKAKFIPYKPGMKNKPYLLLNRNIDGSIIIQNKNNSDYMIY
ncbi:hypothetical protein U3516DRAFT_836433 [Neocallimastix sp. 'constans']